jgi:hypothetical protein
MITEQELKNAESFYLDLKKQKEQQDKFKTNNPKEYLATLLHSNFCRGNHTDVCGWEYENFHGTTRRYWVIKTENLIDDLKKCNITDMETITKLVSIFRGIV